MVAANPAVMHVLWTSSAASCTRKVLQSSNMLLPSTSHPVTRCVASHDDERRTSDLPSIMWRQKCERIHVHVATKQCHADCTFSEFEGGQVAALGSGYATASFVNCEFANNSIVPNAFFDGNHAVIEAQKQMLSDDLAAAKVWAETTPMYEDVFLVPSVLELCSVSCAGVRCTCSAERRILQQALTLL
ncbi:MAG: hypothetical protein HC767_11450 [Akkermansiaceae bacterium]|nr:hypothetical protein [Akkermansiaceae bacterium]